MGKGKCRGNGVDFKREKGWVRRKEDAQRKGGWEREGRSELKEDLGWRGDGRTGKGKIEEKEMEMETERKRKRGGGGKRRSAKVGEEVRSTSFFVFFFVVVPWNVHLSHLS